MRTVRSAAALSLLMLFGGSSAHAVGYQPIKRMLRPGATAPGPEAVAVIAGASHLNGAQYKDLKAASLTLLRTFSPEKHYFVFLGRDAAPISAFLQNLGGKDLAVNFPASSNEAGQDTPEVMKTYVDRIIPPEVLKGGRTIVVVDVTSSGRALDYWVPKLQPHLHGVKAIKVAFSVANNNITQAGDKHIISTTSFNDVDNYLGGIYEDRIAENHRHAPGHHAMSELDTPRPEWGQFRQAIAKRQQADHDLDRALNEIGGVQEDTPAARQTRKAAQIAERTQQAKEIVKLRKFPTEMKKEAERMLTGLPERAEGHDKGPYLGENGSTVNEWLVASVAAQKEAQKVSRGARDEGANQVTRYFITDVLEKALANKQIRKRDYRRLLGHALGFSFMDKEMLGALAKHYKKSPDMRRELTENAEYYQKGSSHQPAGSEAMPVNYAALMQHVSSQ